MSKLARAIGLLLCLTLLGAATAHAGSGDTTTGLVGWWKLEDGSGTSATDSAGSNDGTLINMEDSDWVDGIIGQALYMDGVDEELTLPSPITGAPNAVPFTISLWTYWQGGTASLIRDHTFSDGTLIGWDDSGALKFRVGGATFDTGENAADYQNRWIHWALVNNTTTATLYANGAQIGQVAPGAENIASPWHVLKNGTHTDIIKGMVDDIRFYSSALTEDDVTALYVRSDKFCDNPTDAPGVIRYNADRSALQYCDGDRWVMMGTGSYTPVAAAFDGNDYLTRGAPLSGVVDGKTVTGSFWLKVPNIVRTRNIVTTGNGIYIREYSGVVKVSAKNSSATTILDAYLGSPVDDNKWHHILFSMDLSDAGKWHTYMDGAAYSGTVFTYVDDLMDNDSADSALFAYSNGTNKYDGDVADLWLDYGTYIDFSSAALREKFISANGMPMYLGEDGSLPTGRAPDVFLSGDLADWHTNKGTGGGFTENGALTYASSSPAGISPGGGPCDPANSPSPGQLCYDGSIYAGISPDGSVPMYTTPADAGLYPWNNGNSSGYVTTNQTSTTTGELNTSNLITIDSDSNTGGTQPHQAAQTCADLSSHGHTDWYLPAKDELAVLYTNREAVGGFGTSGSFPIGIYRSSSEFNNNNAWFHRFSDDLQNGGSKTSGMYVRCVRKGYVPIGCANPSAPAGTLIYNTDYKVAQYCNGVDWVAMSKIGGTGGSGCASPAGAAGEIRYASDDEVMQYCNTEDWVNLGKSAAPTSGLIAHWRLDETSGTTAYDSTGNGTAGTMINGLDAGTDNIAGRLGSALMFESASSQYINLPYDADTRATDTQGTVSAWIKPTSTAVGQNRAWPVYWQREHTNTANHGGLILEIHQGGPGAPAYLTARFGNNVFKDLTTPIQDNTWYHVAVIWDASGIAKLYLDGELLKAGAKPGTISNANNPSNFIGYNTDSSGHAYAGGIIDDVRVYGRALSAHEISDLYNATK